MIVSVVQRSVIALHVLGACLRLLISVRAAAEVRDVISFRSCLLLITTGTCLELNV
jgi:hypothetical protein